MINTFLPTVFIFFKRKDSKVDVLLILPSSELKVDMFCHLTLYSKFQAIYSFFVRILLFRPRLKIFLGIFADYRVLRFCFRMYLVSGWCSLKI